MATWLSLDLSEWLEVAVLFAAIYLLLRFLRQTIAGGVFRGPAMLVWIVVFGLFWLLRTLNLDTLALLAKRALPVFLLAMVVTFQTELRHGIARLGDASWWRGLFGRKSDDHKSRPEATEIVNALKRLTQEKVGALIALERNIELTTYIDTGVPMDAIIRSETLTSIFNVNTVLHDGAVVVRRGRIAAAGCLFPLTERPQFPRSFGTRHRAGIGLSELSDALILVASEETGDISLVERGDLITRPTWKHILQRINSVFAEGGVGTPTHTRPKKHTSMQRTRTSPEPS